MNLETWENLKIVLLVFLFDFALASIKTFIRRWVWVISCLTLSAIMLVCYPFVSVKEHPDISTMVVVTGLFWLVAAGGMLKDRLDHPI